MLKLKALGRWRPTPEGLFLFTAILDIGLAAVALFALVGPRGGTFTMDVITETLRFTVVTGDAAGMISGLPVDTVGTERLWSGQEHQVAPKCSGLKFEADPTAAATATYLVRADGIGPPKVQVIGAPGTPSLGRYICPDRGAGAPPSPSEVSLQLLGPRVRLVFRGTLTVGDDPADGDPQPLLLRNGTITVTTPAYPFPSGSSTQRVRLFTGDEVKVVDHGGKSVVSHGIILPENDALRVVAYAAGDRVEVQRPGLGLDQTERAVIAPTLWARLHAESEWPVVVFLGALGLQFLGALQNLSSVAERTNTPGPKETAECA